MAFLRSLLMAIVIFILIYGVYRAAHYDIFWSEVFGAVAALCYFLTGVPWGLVIKSP